MPENLTCRAPYKVSFGSFFSLQKCGTSLTRILRTAIADGPPRAFIILELKMHQNAVLRKTRDWKITESDLVRSGQS